MPMNDSPENEGISVKGSKVSFKITWFITGTLLFALVLNMALSVLTLEKIYSKSLLSEYSVIGRYYAKKIERSLSFGKTLQKFTGMSGFLDQLKQRNQAIYQVFVYSAKRKPLFSLHKDMDYSESLLSGKDVGEKEKLEKKKENYHLVFPLFGGRFKNKISQGYMEIVLPESLIKEKINIMINNSGKLLVMVGVASAIIFFLITLSIIPSREKPGFSSSLRKRALLATSLVLILSQIAFSYFNVSDFRERYFDNIREKCLTLGGLLQADINYLLGLGIRIDKLIKIDTLLNDIQSNIPELSDISIADTKDHILYRVQAQDTKKETQKTEAGASLHEQRPAEGHAYQINLQVVEKKHPSGSVRMNISKQVIDATIRDLIYDSATVAVVSLLIGFECVFFLVALVIYEVKKAEANAFLFGKNKRAAEIRIPAKTSVRTAAFLYAFAMALSMSFLPIYANELYSPIPGLSREVVIALPISGEMLLVAISLLIGGYWLDRKGWFWPFITGAIITGVGMAFCGMARTTTDLILCRGLLGFGYGLTVMSTQSIIINSTTNENRTSSIAALEAGFFSGFLSSTAVGGMLAEKIGFRSVFFVGGILSLVSILFVLVFLKNIRDVGQAEPAGDEKGPLLGRSKAESPTEVRINPLILFKDGEFVGSLILSAIPSSLCLVGFLYFASLLFLSESGVSQANIARLLMPYGLCMVYIAPALSKFADSLENKKIPVILGGILGGGALVGFFLVESIFMFVVVLVLFSISGGLSYSARISSVSNTESAKAIGVGKALGMFNSLERIGNIIGPLIVAAMIASFGLSQAISGIGLMYFIGTILFAGLFFRKSSRAANYKE